jgi:type I restriction enzyme S subunit
VKFDLMTIDEFGKLDRGRSRHRPRDDESLYGGKYPFIQTGDVKAAPFYITNYSQTYNERGLAQSKLWKRGTLCVTIAANIADTAILDFDACFPDSILGFVPFADKSNTKFVKYCFDVYKTTLEAISKGTTQDNLSLEKIKRVKFRIPPLPTQRKIAAILSAYDDLIENNNRRIAILEKMAEELYREWFVRLRFPGHEGVKIVKGVPQGWEVKKIGEVISYQIGGGWGSDTPTGGENLPTYIIRGTDFKYIEKGDFSTAPLRYEKPSSIESRALRHGDIVLENSVNAQSRTTGNTILITQKILDQFDHPVIPASFCKLIRFSDVSHAFYLWQLLRSLYRQGTMEYFQNVATNGIANFQVGRFLEKLLVKIPNNKDLINKFWDFDTSINKVILTNLNATRDRLLSRLMSGKIDVEKLDIQFPKSMVEQGQGEGAEASSL